MIVSDFERKKFLDLDLDQSKFTLVRFSPQQHPFFSMPPPKKNIQKALEDEHYKIRRAYEYTSPFLTIQKTWRMWSQKMRYNRIKRHMKILFWATTRYYKRWFYRKLVFNQKLTQESLRKIGHVRRVQKHWRAFWRKKLLRDIYSVKLQSIYRANRTQKHLPIDFYTDDLTLVLTETDADQFRLGGKVIPGVYLWPKKNFKRSQSFLLDNCKMAMWQVGLRPIRGQDENFTVTRFSNLKPKREPRAVKRKKGLRVGTDLSSQLRQAIVKKVSKKTKSVCLVEVTFDSIADLTWRYNRIVKMRNKVSIYPQKILKRVLAAIRIQSWWKGVMLRKIIKSIFTKEKQRLLTKIDWKNVTLAKTRYYEFVAVFRAAVVIQKFFKSKCLRSRINALVAICQHVKQISNEPLYLEQNLYLNIQQIINTCSRVQLQERKLRYQIIDGVVHMKSPFKRYSQTVLPNWFLEEAGFKIPIIPDNLRNKKDPSLLAVLHHQTNLPEATVVDSYQLQLDQKVRKFVKFQFKSTEEGQKIACLIALLTCQYLKGPTHFVHLLQKDQICESEGNLEQLLMDYKILDIDETFTLRNTQEQVHDGIINKKRDPYSNQLRSRPRHNARDKGQLIILKNADPESVDVEVKNAVTKQKLIRAEEGAVSQTIAQKIETSNLLSGAYQSHVNAILEQPKITKKEQAQQKQEDEKKEVQRFKLQLLNKKLKDLEQKLEQEEKQIQSLESNNKLNESQSQKLFVPGHTSGHASILFEMNTGKRAKSPSFHSRGVSGDKAQPMLLVEQTVQKVEKFLTLNDNLLTYEQQKEIMVQKIKELQKKKGDQAHELSRKKFMASKLEKQHKDELNLSHRRESASRLRKPRKNNESFYITKEDNKVHSVTTNLMTRTVNTQPQRERQERQQAEVEEDIDVQTGPEPKSNYYKIVRKNSATKVNSLTQNRDKARTRAQMQQDQVLPVKQVLVSKTSIPQRGFISESQKQPLPKITIETAEEKPIEFKKTGSLDPSYNFLGVPHSNRNSLPQTLSTGNQALPVKRKQVSVFQTSRPQHVSQIPKQPVPKTTIDSVAVPIQKEKPKILQVLPVTMPARKEQLKILAQSMSMQDLLSVKNSNLLKNQFTKTQKKLLENTPKSFKVEGWHQDKPNTALSTQLKSITPPPDVIFYKDQKNVLKSPHSPKKLVSFKTLKKINTARLLKTTASHTILPSLKVFENIQLQNLLVAKNLENTQPTTQVEAKPLVQLVQPKVTIPLKSQQILPMFPNHFHNEMQGFQVNNTISTKINNIKKIRTNQIPTTQKNTPRKAENIQRLMLSGTGNRVQAIPKKTKPGHERKKFGSSGSLGFSDFSDVKKSTKNKRKVPYDHDSSIESFYSEYDSQLYHIQRARLLSAKPTPTPENKKATKRNKALPQSTIEHVISQRKENSQKAMTKKISKIFTAHSEKAVYSLMPSKSFLPRIKKGTSLARLQSEIINQQILGDFCRF